MNTLRLATALGFALLSGAAMAQSASTNEASAIEGTWVSDGGYATFDVSLCGDGTQLCADLVSLSEETVAPLLDSFVGKQLFADVPSKAPGQWEATISLGEVQATGTFTLIEPNRVEAKGCLLQDCRSIFFNKAE